MPSRLPPRTVRRILAALVVVGVAWFTVANQSALGVVVAAVGRADPVHLTVGVSLSVAAMANRGLLYRAAHGAVGLDAPLPGMVRAATVGFAANKIVRSGGMTGLAVFLRHGRRHGFACGAVGAACLLASAASFLALGLLLATVIGLLALAGDLTGWWLAAAAGFAVVLGAIAVGTTIVVWRRHALRRLGRRLATAASRRLSRPALAAGATLDDLSGALAVARSDPGASRRVVAHAIASKVLGAGMLLAAASAAGIRISPTAALVVYGAALTTSLVAIVPSGLGAVEASTAALLVSADTPLAVAAVAVGLFRLFDLWLPLATGAWLGRHELRADRGDGVRRADPDGRPEAGPSGRRSTTTGTVGLSAAP